MSQQSNRLSECNRCKDAGLPSQMVGLVKMYKVKQDGKPFWKLLNEDLSYHVHKNETVLTERDIEEKEKPSVRPSMEDNSYPTNDKDEMIFRTCSALKEIAKILKNSGLYMGVKQSDDLRL